MSSIALHKLGQSVRPLAAERGILAATDCLDLAARAHERGDHESARLWRGSASALLHAHGAHDLALSLDEAEELLADIPEGSPMIRIERTRDGLWRVWAGASVVAMCSYSEQEGIKVLNGRLFVREQNQVLEQIQRRTSEQQRSA